MNRFAAKAELYGRDVVNRPKNPHKAGLAFVTCLSAALAGALALAPVGATAAGLTHPRANAARAQPASTGTSIVINGRRPGTPFNGIGAISGGGGNSRYLIDYRATPQSEILNYLFGPGGANLQLLKLEIGGDANSSDGSEPSIEHNLGQIDCESGYEWWLARQALNRDPSIKLYGLQWAAPGWVGSVWSKADVRYVIRWLNCAKSHGLKISYLGGWNENRFNVAWNENMRRALNANGYRSVKIVGADDISARAWRIAAAAATHPALKAAISVLGVHDTCGFPTTGYHCVSTAAARRLGKPLWESELGAMDANTGAANMARSINNGYIQAKITGYLEWPLVDAMPPGLQFENRGLVTADQPESGAYNVNRITWAIAQTTQFVKPGWRHVNGANKELGNSGSYNAYEAPNRHDWSLVAENAGGAPFQAVFPQTIHVQLTGGLATGTVHVWWTNLMSSDPSTWFVQRPDIHATGGAFSYSIPPGYVVSFTSTSNQSHYVTTSNSPGPITLPYQASKDGSNEAWGLASQEGAFIYRRCLGGIGGQCLEQVAGQEPVWWHKPLVGTPTPYAIVGDPSWQNYTVMTKILFTTTTGWVSLIGRFGSQGRDPRLFTGYKVSLSARGQWHITRDSDVAEPIVLASGKLAAIKPGTWQTIAFSLRDSAISFSLNGTVIGTATDGHYASGLAGIGSDWHLVQFDGLTVSQGLGPGVTRGIRSW
jgi:hypothetical protein